MSNVTIVSSPVRISESAAPVNSVFWSWNPPLCAETSCHWSLPVFKESYLRRHCGTMMSRRGVFLVSFCSSRRLRFSRLSWFSSMRSSVVSPSLRSPTSLSLGHLVANWSLLSAQTPVPDWRGPASPIRSRICCRCSGGYGGLVRGIACAPSQKVGASTKSGQLSRIGRRR